MLLETKQYSKAELNCQKLLTKLQIASEAGMVNASGSLSVSEGQGPAQPEFCAGSSVESEGQRPPVSNSIRSLKNASMIADFHRRLREEAALNLQLAAISEAQNLSDEVRQRVGEALEIYTELDGADSLGAAACYHLLASCYCLSKHKLDGGLDDDDEEDQQEEEDEEDEVDVAASERMLERALRIRSSLLGDGHPETLQSKRLLVTVRRSPGRPRSSSLNVCFSSQIFLSTLAPTFSDSDERAAVLGCGGCTRVSLPQQCHSLWR